MEEGVVTEKPPKGVNKTLRGISKNLKEIREN